MKQYGLLGKATKWVDLAGRWAYPGFDKNKYPSLEAAMKVRATYGQRILDLHSKMLAIEVPEPETGVDLSNIPEWAQESWIWAYENGLNDGVVQNEFELQMVKMLHAYHLKFVKEGK